MERLVINTPSKESALVKQVLKNWGNYSNNSDIAPIDNKQKLTQVSISVNINIKSF